MEFVVAAFNAHWGVGRFGAHRNVRFDVARLVRSFDADIVVVPEAWRSDTGEGVLDSLTGDGYHVETIEFMPLAQRVDRHSDLVPRNGLWELAVCSRFPVIARRLVPLGVVRRDPAGFRHALALTLDVGGTPVEVIGVHTSSKVWRLAPVRHLRTLRRDLRADGPQIIAGDFNFWGPPVGAILRGWQRAVRGRTFSSRRPHSQIDHVLVRGGIEVVDGEVLADTPSDHLPIRARLRLVQALT